MPDIKEERNIWAHEKREREGNEKDKDKTRFQSVRSRLYFYYYLKKKKKEEKRELNASLYDRSNSIYTTFAFKRMVD